MRPENAEVMFHHLWNEHIWCQVSWTSVDGVVGGCIGNVLLGHQHHAALASAMAPCKVAQNQVSSHAALVEACVHARYCRRLMVTSDRLSPAHSQPPPPLQGILILDGSKVHSPVHPQQVRPALSAAVEPLRKQLRAPLPARVLVCGVVSCVS